VRVTEELHILAVGPAPPGLTIRDCLRDRLRCRVSNADSLRQLWIVPRTDSVDLAILNEALSPSDFEDASRFIRRQWPAARILILRTDSDSLDDALYDERVLPTATADIFIDVISRLTRHLREDNIS
jgi:hypothetical protein